MEKSIMAMADDILGGTLSSPAKVVSKPVVQEHELPEMNDSFRESLIEGSVMNEVNVPLTPSQRIALNRRGEGRRAPSSSKGPGAYKPGGPVFRRVGGKVINVAASGTTSTTKPTTKENIEILLKARDILREMTTVGSNGVGAARVTGSRAHSTHGADMGKDTVPVQAPDKAMPKEKKSKKKKVKKESFDRFLDRVINEHQERR